MLNMRPINFDYTREAVIERACLLTVEVEDARDVRMYGVDDG